jgi:hypothetical protein
MGTSSTRAENVSKAAFANLTAAQRSQRARIAALARSAAYDGREVTAAATAASQRRFYNQAVREAEERGEQLSEKELERRARALRRLYFTRMAYASLKARQKKAARGSTASSSTAEPLEPLGGGSAMEDSRGPHTATPSTG